MTIPRAKGFAPLLLRLLAGWIFISIPLLVGAAGGGGGGGGTSVAPPPPCDKDTWECGQWSICSLQGTQSRTCNLTFDCPTAESQKPAEEQTCVPACTEDLYSCADWSACGTGGRQSRRCGLTSDCPLTTTPKPIEEQRCVPECTADTWTCGNYGPCKGGTKTRVCGLTFDCPAAQTPKPGETEACVEACLRDEWKCADWSQCNENGRQTRSCRLTRDCPGVTAARPEESRICPGLRCGHLPSLKERISCRLKLSDAELTNEFKILYAPETCKALTDAEEKVECVRLYQVLGGCWVLSVGNARNACAKKVIGIEDIPRGKSECARRRGTERENCLEELKDKVRYLTVFRMYDLEVRAEDLVSRGAPRELVADLDALIETKKQEMYKTNNPADWKRIVRETQVAWRKFVNAVRPYIK